MFNQFVRYTCLFTETFDSFVDLVKLGEFVSSHWIKISLESEVWVLLSLLAAIYQIYVTCRIPMYSKSFIMPVCLYFTHILII